MARSKDPLLAVLTLVAAFALGCGKAEESKTLVDVKTPLGDVKVDSNDNGVSVDVQAGSAAKE